MTLSSIWVLAETAEGKALPVSLELTLALGVLASGFLLRTYIVFHDCSHGSYLPSKRGNQWLGSALGVLVFAPFANWRHNHAVHHATAADLDRRGQGDVPTLTEHELCKMYFEERGVRTIMADPRALEYREGKLGHRAQTRLAQSEDFDDLLLLEECDQRGRRPGADVCTLDEALQYIRSLADNFE